MVCASVLPVFFVWTFLWRFVNGCSVILQIDLLQFIEVLTGANVILLCSLLFLIKLLQQEQEFLQKQQQELDSALKKIIQQHKLEIATIERDCLNHKQQLMRGQIFLVNLLLQVYICEYA